VLAFQPDDRTPVNRRHLAGLLLLALGTRLLYLLLVPRVLDTADAIHYAEATRFLASFSLDQYNAKIPVLYPAAAAVFHSLGLSAEAACRLVSFIASTLTVLPAYLLARACVGQRVALWTGVFVALWPWLADYGCRVSTEGLAVCLWLTAAWLLASPVTTLRRTADAGFVLGALYLTRAEGLFVLLGSVPVVLLRVGGRQRLHLAAYTFATLPWLILGTLFNRRVAGETTANYRVGFIVEEFDYARFLHTIVATVTDVLPVMLGPLLLVFLGAFLLHLLRERCLPSRLLVALWLAGIQWASSWFVLSPAPRYLMAPLIVLSMLALAGMLVFSRELPRFKALPQWLLAGWLLVGSVVTIASEHAGRRPRQPREYKEAGLWMRDHLEPGLIFTRKPQVAFYAEMPSTGPLDTESTAETLARADEAGADYLVVDERYAPANLRPLLADPSLAKAWRIVHDITPYPESRVLVFERRRP